MDSDGDGSPDGADASGSPIGGEAAPSGEATAALTPEEAERYLQALEEMRPPHSGKEARGRPRQVEKDW